MNEWLNHSDYAAAPLSIPTLVLSVLLAFLIGQTIAWVYMLTHTGLSYSRSFVNSLIVIPMIVALVMTVMANNLVTAFGMMAVFAIVRFRNILRDTFDSTYILWSLAMGMACGTQRFPVAIVGCLLTGAAILYLGITSFGTRLRGGAGARTAAELLRHPAPLRHHRQSSLGPAADGVERSAPSVAPAQPQGHLREPAFA